MPKSPVPNAEVVYDLFHVVAKYGREVIDRVRVDEANRVRTDKPARRVVKTSRWLLLRNRHNVPAEHRSPSRGGGAAPGSRTLGRRPDQRGIQSILRGHAGGTEDALRGAVQDG